jgi:small-conductance mechanosensitive channel
MFAQTPQTPPGWFDSLADELSRMMAESAVGGLLTLIVAFLTLLLFFLLPRGERRFIRAPLLLFTLHLVLLMAATILPPGTQWEKTARDAANLVMLLGFARIIYLFLARSLVVRRLARPFPKIFLDILQGAMFGVAVFIGLAAAGVKDTSLLTGSAVLTATLGFALQDTLGNMFAGVSIQMQRPFEVDDWIQFDEKPFHVGRVVEINWRATKVITLDEVEVIVPNSVLAKAPIRNFTKPSSWSRRNIYFTAPYDVPPRKVHEIVLKAIEGAWGVLDRPSASIVTNDFTERGIEYWVRVFTVEFSSRDRVDGGVRDRIWYGLHRNGIKIPVPGRAVQLRELSPEGEIQIEEAQAALRAKALCCVDFLAALPDDDRRRLATLVESRLYAEGETLIRQGDPGDELFILMRGQVVVLLEREDGQTVELSRLGKGEFFGERSLMTGEPRTATIAAVQESEALVVCKGVFRQFLERSPDMADKISHIMAARLKERDAALLAHAQREMVEEDVEVLSQRLLARIREFFSL